RAAVHAGYTLVELLVALAIVAVLAGMVALSAGLAEDAGAVLERETRALLERMEFAAEDAVLSGETIGLFIMPPAAERGWRYRWRRYRMAWEDAAQPLDEVVLPAALA